MNPWVAKVGASKIALQAANSAFLAARPLQLNANVRRPASGLPRVDY